MTDTGLPHSDQPTCRYCGSTNLVTEPAPPHTPHHAQTSCANCGRWLKWEAAPMTDERAANFVMPYGKHGGETLAQITATTEGVRYLRWMLAEGKFKPSVKRYVVHHLRTVVREQVEPL